MKKILSLLMILSLAAFAAACGNNESGEDSEDDWEQFENDNSPGTATGDNLGAFNKSAVLSESVMYDEKGVKITVTGLTYTNYSVELELTIENNSGKDLSFVSGSLGYCCNSVNGYMVNDGYLNCDVTNGKKANDSISFDYEGLMVYGINEIADIEIGFDISDDDYNHTYSGPRQVKTSAYDAHDYETDCYQETITSSAAMNTYNYEIAGFSQDTLYNANGVKLLSSGLMVNQDGKSALLLEFENTSDNMVYVSTSDIAVNDLVIYDSTWSSNAVNPGRRVIAEIELESLFEEDYWGIYGIEDIGSVTLTLAQSNADGDDIAEEAAIKVTVPGVKAEYDASGQEVYNSGGLRIIAKTLIEDSYKYSSDLHLLLLAENNSGKSLYIDDVSNSLSVNGYMTDYYFYGKELDDGKCAAIDVTLRESSLEKNNISSVSDVKEIEVGLEIEEGYDTIDKPVLKFSFD
ncbi:MAG: catabolite control protein A [Clostridia bacterium]|nr:catabolite control protein A [Clostridia bacterium]